MALVLVGVKGSDPVRGDGIGRVGAWGRGRRGSGWVGGGILDWTSQGFACRLRGRWVGVGWCQRLTGRVVGEFAAPVYDEVV